MKQWKYLLMGIFSMAILVPAMAQNSHIRKGDKLYESMVYPQAITRYEKGLRTVRDLRAMERLADSYKQVGNTAGAERPRGL